MMLDDFLTLTERNYGLTIPSRVKELVDVIQKENDSVVNDVSEITKQWSAVACAIAATENRECISLFLHLDGLHFFGKWLKDAVKFGTNSTDSSLEDAIVHLLQALEKLQIGNEKLVSNDVWTIVKGLLVHSSLKVQEKAQIIFDTWESRKTADASPSDVVGVSINRNVQKNGDYGGGSENLVSGEVDKSFPLDIYVKGVNNEAIGDDEMSASFDVIPSKAESIQDPDKTHSSPGAGQPLVHSELPVLISQCSSAVNSVELCDASANDNAATDSKNTLAPETSSTEPGIAEGWKSSENNNLCLGSSSSNPVASGTEPSSQNFQVNEAMDHRSSANHGKSSSPSTMEEREQYSMSVKSSSGQRSLENTMKPTLRDRGKSKKPELHMSGDNITRSYKLMKTEVNREHNRADKIHDIDVYGIVDPLELARQVAIEVQREVVESRDQSCSSSEKLPEENEKQPYSPNSESARKSKISQGSLKGEYDTDLSDDTSLMRGESSSSIENPEVDQANEAQEMENSLVTEVSQEANTEKALCSFDLNQELSSEDVDGPADHLLPPVSVVSTAGEVAAPGAGASLQFDGIPGWKGSAATSAFRPMGQKLPENDKDISTGRSITNSKQRQECLDIDLNAVEINVGKMGAMLPDKKLPTLSDIPSGECSMETSQTRSERFKLDLNCFSDDSTCPSDLHIGLSHAAPTKQPSLMSFDLNDQPSFLGEVSDHSSLNKSPQSLKAPGGMKPDDSISIMGTRVKVNQKEFVSPTPPIPSMQTPELSFDVVNFGRGGNFAGTGSMFPYSRFPGHSYQNIAPSPAMPFPSSMYAPGGPIPYMVDSRGAPVIPQIIAPATTLPTGFPQIPFFMNIPPAQGPSNGFTPISPLRGGSFDLNGGSMVEGSGSRDPPGFTQFLNLGQSRPTEEHLRSNSLPFSSFVTGKRKEPENGWEPYPVKHHTPPWK